MSYRYRRIDVRKGWIFWAARPVRVSKAQDGDHSEGLDLVPSSGGCGETWWRGLTRQHAIARAYRWAKRQNRRADREDNIQSIEFGA